VAVPEVVLPPEAPAVERFRSFLAWFFGFSFARELGWAIRREVDREGEADRQHQPDDRGEHVSQRAHVSTVATALFRNGKAAVNDR
jgi:hypothetical protein